MPTFRAASIVVGIGEVLWDRFPHGDLLGGAPANFAFSAALVLGLLRGDSLRRIADTANRIGAYVASQPGAMARLPEALLKP